MSLRVGVLGAGQAGERHAIGFAANSEAEVVAVADLDRSRVEALAHRLGATAYTQWKDVFAQGLDIVVIALPHALHVAPARAAAERGVHVLMEKPIATSLQDAHVILDACGSAGVHMAVGFVHRYRAEVLKAKRWMERVGTPQIARESMASQRTAQHPRWITQRSIAGGGVLLYGAIHGVDRLRWLLGQDVVRVDARVKTYAPDTEVEDGIAALLEYENGATATLTANAPLYRAQPAPWDTEVYGDRARVRVRTREWADYSAEGEQERFDVDDDVATREAHYNFARQADDLVRAVLDVRAPSVDGLDGLRALETCLAMYRSAQERRPVSIEEIRTERNA